jgi:hypothetical protein
MEFRASDPESLLVEGHRAQFVSANVEGPAWRKISTGRSWSWSIPDAHLHELVFKLTVSR